MPLKSRMLLQTLDAIDNLNSPEGSTLPEILRYIQHKLKVKGREAHPTILTLVRHALYKAVQLKLLCQHGKRYFRYEKLCEDRESSNGDFDLIPKESYCDGQTLDSMTTVTSQSEAITESSWSPKDKCPPRKRIRKFKVCYRRKRKNRRRKNKRRRGRGGCGG